MMILLISLIFHILIIINSNVTFYSDDAIYAELAKYWISGQWQYVFHPVWPPLYPFFSAIFYLLIPNWETALRLVSTVSAIFLIIPLFYLIKIFLPNKYAYFYSVSITLFTPLLNFSVLPFSDMLATLFIISSLTMVFFTMQVRKLKFFILAGFLIGLTYLTRSEGLLFFYLTTSYLSFYFFINYIKKKDLRYFLYIFSFIFIFFLTISPYWISSRIKLETWSLSAKFSAQIQQGHAFALRENNETWSQEIISLKSPNFKSPYFHDGTKYILDHIDFFYWWFKQKVINWWSLYNTLFSLWPLPIIIFGFISTFWRKNREGFIFLIYMMVTAIPITIFSTAINDIRYLLWAFPLLILFFYLGVEFIIKFFDKIFKIRQLKFSKYLPIFLSLVLFFPSFSIADIANPLNYARSLTHKFDRPYFKQVSEWIKKDATHQNPKIMMRHESIAYYSNGEIIYLPQAELQKVLEYGKSHQTDYLVAWDGELAVDPNLSILLKNDISPSGLKKVYSLSTKEGKIIVYKFANLKINNFFAPMNTSLALIFLPSL